MKALTSSEKDIISKGFLDGKSARQIACEMKISPTTAIKYKPALLPTIPKSKGGRPKVLSATTKRYIIQKVTTGQVSTASELHKQLNEGTDTPVSYTSVLNVLYSTGLRGRNKIKKPFLTKKHQKARMDFESWTVEDWKQVVFSDESKINRLSSDGKHWCWKKRGEPMKPSHLKEVVKHGGGSLMVWGCLTSKGIGDLCRIDGGLDADLYCKILGDELLSTLRYYHLKKSDTIFQQDNDPKHTSKKAQQWIKANKLEVLNWPANSPDLNPIEHVWSYLKQSVYSSNTPPSSIHELWQQVQDKWNEIPLDYIKELYGSMPNRIQAVKRAKGGHTKY